MNTKMTKTKISALTTRLKDLEVQALRLPTAYQDIKELDAMKRYEKALEQLEKSHSRSWIGDHAYTYYEGFQSPPGGRTFDVEWGFHVGYSGEYNPNWETHSRKDIINYIFADVHPELREDLKKLSKQQQAEFEAIHDQIIDVLEVLTSYPEFAAVKRYKGRLEDKLKPCQDGDFIKKVGRSVPRTSRDSEEVMKGQVIPEHVLHLDTLMTLQDNAENARNVAVVLRNIIQAVSIQEGPTKDNGDPRHVFIGHGRSDVWRALKDFLSDRLDLDYEEFNRLPVAGINTQERLMEMLDTCGFAFLVLTGEDVQGDDELHARANVVHEAGLFQGRLGLRKAIILLEEGCQEFSNIVGLGQIRFAKGDISTCFEEIRRVLEREGLIQAP